MLKMRPQPLLMPSATGMTFKNRLFLLLLLVIGLQLLVIEVAENSPGGSADLLAITWLLHQLNR